MRAEALAAEFAIPGVLAFEDTETGLVKAVIASGGAEAELYLHGAQLTRWQPAGQKPVIFTSAESGFAPGVAIRGGIPVVFPWFGPYRGTAAKAPQHGFARVLPWRLESVGHDAGSGMRLTLVLESDAGTAALFPGSWRVSHSLTIGRDLALELTVDNLSPQPLSFEAAWHSYFVVSDIDNARVSGLAGRSYIDKVAGGERRVQAASPLAFAGETDSVYLDTAETCALHDSGWQRRITLAKAGAASTIVWNPWRDKARAMKDLGDDEWRRFLCVETGNAADNAVRLEPQGRHRMTTLITIDADG
jgi:glucose-6-phosphate 1-epimerase